MSGFGAARRRGIAVACLLLAGCESASVPVAQGPVAPAPETPPFFVGRWAAAETACGHAAWSFTEDGLSTPGAVVCDFDRVKRTPEGYDITAVCWAEGPPETGRIKLSYAQSARAMLVEGGPFNPVGLIACDGRQP